ncbi:MAG: alpha/beta hydrolase-fold protein [Saprospiraceae bacterium]|nr:alpha/beta hydrolase-fold protein [Saprospiraceae bacterium]
MKQSYIILFLLAFFACKTSPRQTERTVKIVLDTEEALSEADTIYLTGNTNKLGDWNPKGMAMTRRSESRWEKSFTVPDSTLLHFKFTLGSFEREAVSNRGNIPGNNEMFIIEDTEVYFVLEDWKNPLAPVQVSAGKVMLHVVNPLNGLASRKVTVWLPDSYEMEPNKKFPVLYLHDGQNQFDGSKTFNGQEWKIDETLNKLDKEEKIRVPICVAIDNTMARMEEYGSVTAQSAYADFIVHQLKPFIDSLYRTLPDRRNTATMGASLGGLIAFHLSWYHNETFSMAACLSPGFRYKNLDLSAELKKYKGPKKDILLYIDNGTAGIESELQPGIDATVNFLKSNGYPVDYTIAEGAEHTEEAWASRVAQPMILFFGTNK